MFNKLIELYTKGDLAQLSSSILHSTAWQQHDFTAYGNMQIENLWLKSLEQFGFLPLAEQQTVQGDGFSALYFELSVENQQYSLAVSFFFEHNEQHIKRLRCIVDTLALAKLQQNEGKQIQELLPTPDPLLLSQFDHQLHPQSYHATPKDVCDLPKDIDNIMSQWWNIWQEKQLASFASLYNDDSQIKLAGSATSCGFHQLRSFHLKLHNRLNRSYCQLENICYDSEQNTLAILWHIDGDYLDVGATKRVRIPMMSFLTIEDNKIVKEQLQVDWLSFTKRFQLHTAII
ncbi:nuclear transport factor 2 family protein [Thalassotalea fonticola]|uniref:Nuclear transport factor 2 family protein n=1 Tax=Thalassotalea fonticola TaxID=3065649 RepID=A0ABZ0GIY1_9GAMM|nr:nuclear transport factor 2 family protein [Colwelliaceae bacterium S1-1]